MRAHFEKEHQRAANSLLQRQAAQMRRAFQQEMQGWEAERRQLVHVLEHAQAKANGPQRRASAKLPAAAPAAGSETNRRLQKELRKLREALAAAVPAARSAAMGAAATAAAGTQPRADAALLAHIKDLFAGRELAAQEANAKICKKLDSICDALQQLVRRGNKLAAAVVVSAGPPGDHP